MSCPHSLRAMPADCSQCLHAPVRRVSIIGHELHVDGVPVGRQVDDEPRQRMALMKKRRPR